MTEPGNVPEDPVDIEPVKRVLKKTLASIKLIEKQDPRLESWEFFVRPSDQDKFQEILSQVGQCLFEEEDLSRFFPSPPDPEFEKAFDAKEHERMLELKKEISELEAMRPKDPVQWKVKNEELALRREEYEELKKGVGDLRENTKQRTGNTVFEGTSSDQVLDDIVVSEGKALKSRVESLYRQVLRKNKPIKTTTKEDLRQTAIDVIKDDPSRFDPITEAHLQPDALYNTEPSRTKRDFCGKLLKDLLETRGCTVSNYKELYSSIWSKTPLHKTWV